MCLKKWKSEKQEGQDTLKRNYLNAQGRGLHGGTNGSDSESPQSDVAVHRTGLQPHGSGAGER